MISPTIENAAKSIMAAAKQIAETDKIGTGWVQLAIIQLDAKAIEDELKDREAERFSEARIPSGTEREEQ